MAAVRIPLAPLGGPIDAAFPALYSALATGGAIDWRSFHAATAELLNARGQDPAAVDAYFNNFTIAWTTYLQQGAFRNAGQIWLHALYPVYEWEEATGQQVHKGTAYYFSGATAILAGDIDAGFLFMHQALEEDRRTTGDPRPDRPAWRFVSLDSVSLEQFFRPRVVRVAHFVSDRLERYRRECGGTLGLVSLRDKLLAYPDRLEAAFYFFYAMFKADRLLSIESGFRVSPFAALLDATILFHVYVALEELLRYEFPTGGAMHGLVVQTSMRLNLSVHALAPVTGQDAINAVRGAFLWDAEATLRAVLDRQFPSLPLTPSELALAIAPPMRNHAAHRLQALPVLLERFDDLLQLALTSIFFVIEQLY
jgi:hypothetical protein